MERSKRWKERRADPTCVRGTRIPVAHLSACPLAHTDSAGCPGIPHYLLLSVCTKLTVWLIHVKDGLSFEYLQISRTLAGVSHSGVEQIWFCLACWSGQELNLEAVRLFTTSERHWHFSQLPLLITFATGRYLVALQKVRFPFSVIYESVSWGLCYLKYHQMSLTCSETIFCSCSAMQSQHIICLGCSQL